MLGKQSRRDYMIYICVSSNHGGWGGYSIAILLCGWNSGRLCCGCEGRIITKHRRLMCSNPYLRRGNEIGDRCLFLGTNESTCISPAPRGCHSNCIYLTDDIDLGGSYHSIAGHDMVVYSMDTGKFTPLYDGVSLSQFSPPLWVTLNSCQ